MTIQPALLKMDSSVLLWESGRVWGEDDCSDSPLISKTSLAPTLTLTSKQLSSVVKGEAASPALDQNGDAVLKSHGCFHVCLGFKENVIVKGWTNILLEQIWALRALGFGNRLFPFSFDLGGDMIYIKRDVPRAETMSSMLWACHLLF